MNKTRIICIVTGDGRYELPVNPTEISVTQDSKDKTIDLLNIGEVNVVGNRGLIKVTLSTFLPDESSHFYKGTPPETIIQAVKKAKNGKKTVRLIITGTDVNTLFTVSSMNETYKEGQGDIYIAWVFTESRELNTGQVASFVKRYTPTDICTRNTAARVPKTATVLQGDTLWDIAKRYYDDGSRWKDIAEANGLTEDSVTAGRKLVIPQ